MWRHKPEWDEAQRRLKGETPCRTFGRSTLDESLIHQFMGGKSAKTEDNMSRVDLLLLKEEILEQGRGANLMDGLPKRKPNLPLMNPDIIDDAIKTWGRDKQYTQLVEECGEYVTEAMHLLFRPDRPDDLPHFLEEVVGVRIAVDHVIRLHQEQCEEIYKQQIGKELAAMKRVADTKEILSCWGPI